MRFRVRILPEAQEQARELHKWWKENRPASRTSVKQELREVAKGLVRSPKRHPFYDEEREVRHCPIQGTPYHVFFRVSDERHEVDVVAVWSAVQRAGPSV